MDATPKDIGSVLTHIEQLQKQLAAKEAELRESKQREDEAKRQAESLNNTNLKLTEA
jgi:cell division protein FtsB